jgi:hypothetical protein
MDAEAMLDRPMPAGSVYAFSAEHRRWSFPLRRSPKDPEDARARPTNTSRSQRCALRNAGAVRRHLQLIVTRLQ